MQEVNEKPLISYSKRYRNYVLMMLTLVYTLSFADRQILVVIQESIKQELNLSDTQLGLLSGFAFALFYVTLGLPIARWADKGNRRNIVSISLTIWSAMTALSGFVSNYSQLLLARIGVGIGEAGGMPPSTAMISDYFPAKKRGTALSIHSMGIFFGIILGFLVGGIIDQYYGWRMAFLALGIPGIVVAVLFHFTVKEPPKGYQRAERAGALSITSWQDQVNDLFNKKTFRYMALAAGLHSFAGYGTSSFFAPYLIRVHGFSTLEVGIGLAGVIGIAGATGTFLGGYIGDRMVKKDLKWYLLLPAIANLISLPFAAVAFFSVNPMLALLVYIIPNVTYATYIGPSLAVLHGLVPAEQRSFSTAIYHCITNLIGLGLGPLTVGFISDQLAPSMGADSLRWALASTLFMVILSSTLFYLASKNVKKDLKH